jgi:hypothetical protein
VIANLNATPIANLKGSSAALVTVNTTTIANLPGSSAALVIANLNATPIANLKGSSAALVTGNAGGASASLEGEAGAAGVGDIFGMVGSQWTNQKIKALDVSADATSSGHSLMKMHERGLGLGMVGTAGIGGVIPVPRSLEETLTHAVKINPDATSE